MKFVFSQTPFVCLQTLPEGTYGGQQSGLTIYPPGKQSPNDVPVADADSNGWPQTARDRTLRIIKQANALHVCGDQHLGSLVQYGIDIHGDGTYVFCTPAIANTWPRRWTPQDLSITGEHEDGFGNKMTVLAVSNPQQTGKLPAALHDRSPGWGLLQCNPANSTVTINAWPRWAKPNAPDTDQYKGWPITLKQIGKNIPAVLGITPDDLRNLLNDKSIVLIDVREVDEFEKERISGALNFPLSTFSVAEISTVAGDKEVVFHCRSGYRSSLASKEYYNWKKPQKHLEGGILAWKENGNKTVSH
jgi:rhodanese-related sulfurtransferase